MLTTAEQQWKRYSLWLCILGFVVGYYLCDWLVRDRLSVTLPVFSWEQRMPFVPEAIWGYLLPYPIVLATYFLLDDFPIYRRFVWRYAVLLAIHLLCFLLFPATIQRPPVTSHSDLSLFATALYYAIDPPQNLFPSFHVALPLLCALCTWPYHRLWGSIFLAATVLIAASVVLVKQHYVVDVLGGIAVAGIATLSIRTTSPTAGSGCRFSPGS